MRHRDNRYQLRPFKILWDLAPSYCPKLIPWHFLTHLNWAANSASQMFQASSYFEAPPKTWRLGLVWGRGKGPCSLREGLSWGLHGTSLGSHPGSPGLRIFLEVFPKTKPSVGRGLFLTWLLSSTSYFTVVVVLIFMWLLFMTLSPADSKFHDVRGHAWFVHVCTLGPWCGIQHIAGTHPSIDQVHLCVSDRAEIQKEPTFFPPPSY